MRVVVTIHLTVTLSLASELEPLPLPGILTGTGNQNAQWTQSA
jgi:hypothetical protein